jgi:hypothetical protein
MAAYPPGEVEAAFRHYFLTGPVGEDWIAWSQLFTADATYNDHFWGTFHGPAEIQRFLEGTMSFAAHVYSPLVWYNIDGPHVVYKVVNRADNPEPGGEHIEFPSLQVIQYAGDGKWASEDDWWTVQEMKLFNQRYAGRPRAGRRQGPRPAVAPQLGRGDSASMGRRGAPTDGRPRRPGPSWRPGRTPDLPPGDIDVGVRHPRSRRPPVGRWPGRTAARPGRHILTSCAF